MLARTVRGGGWVTERSGWSGKEEKEGVWALGRAEGGFEVAVALAGVAHPPGLARTGFGSAMKTSASGGVAFRSLATSQRALKRAHVSTVGQYHRHFLRAGQPPSRIRGHPSDVWRP